MNTQTFLNTLNQHTDKQLLFEYAPDKFAGANYHITEVKHVTIDSVDCGAQTDSWKETIVQLWESPKEIDKKEFMTVQKALDILNKVGLMKSYTLDADIKIEYSNANFHTAQQYIQDVVVNENQLIVKLSIQKTACKANELCGITEKEELELASSCCEPSSGCC